MIDYNKIKHSIPPIEAAKRYGTVKHSFMRCPFHADRAPSLKLYGDHFHCFGCGAYGDVIDLTAGAARPPKIRGGAAARSGLRLRRLCAAARTGGVQA